MNAKRIVDSCERCTSNWDAKGNIDCTASLTCAIQAHEKMVNYLQLVIA